MLTSVFVVLVIRFKTQIIYQWYEWRIEILKKQSRNFWSIADFYSDLCDEKNARKWIAKAFEAEVRGKEYERLKEKYNKKGGE